MRFLMKKNAAGIAIKLNIIFKESPCTRKLVKILVDRPYNNNC